MKHYFMTLPDVVFPENRFCARCGEYLTHSNHLHARECPCLKCQQERLLTKRAADGAVCPECSGRDGYHKTGCKLWLWEPRPAGNTNHWKASL